MLFSLPSSCFVLGADNRNVPDRSASLTAFNRVSAYREPTIRPPKPASFVASCPATISLVCKSFQQRSYSIMVMRDVVVPVPAGSDGTWSTDFCAINRLGRPSNGTLLPMTSRRRMPRPERRATITMDIAMCSSDVARSILPAHWPPYDAFCFQTRALPPSRNGSKTTGTIVYMVAPLQYRKR